MFDDDEARAAARRPLRKNVTTRARTPAARRLMEREHDVDGVGEEIEHRHAPPGVALLRRDACG